MFSKKKKKKNSKFKFKFKIQIQMQRISFLFTYCSNPNFTSRISSVRYLSTETSETRKRRLIWHSNKRGTVENELILGSYAKKKLSQFSEDQLDAFDKILQESDPDLFKWLTKNEQPPQSFLDSHPQIPIIINELRTHVQQGASAPSIFC